jgi:hypothetical protein
MFNTSTKQMVKLLHLDPVRSKIKRRGKYIQIER